MEAAGSGGSPSQNKKEETLYDWMRRLQAQGSAKSKSDAANDNVAIEIEPEEIEATVTEPEAIPLPMPLPSAASTKSLHLLDAHIIFEPLLSSLGLMPQQIQNLSLKNLGSNVSVLANIAEFRFSLINNLFFFWGWDSHNLIASISLLCSYKTLYPFKYAPAWHDYKNPFYEERL